MSITDAMAYVNDKKVICLARLVWTESQSLTYKIVTIQLHM